MIPMNTMLNASAVKIRLFFVIIFVCFPKSFEFEFVVFTNKTSSEHFRIVKRQNPQPDVPRIKEFYVTTRVANRFAETSVVSKVENPDTQSKQTAFSVVLPVRAFISGFHMEIDGTLYRGYVKEKEEARRLFNNKLSTGETAGHVSTRDSSRFTVNINVASRSKVTFCLNYEELLKRENSQYEIVTSIQPGQIVKKLKVEVSINESLPLLFVITPYLRSGSNALLQPKDTLDPHAKVRISNTSAHVIFEPDVSRQYGFACAGLGTKEYDGFAGQFVVQYDVNRTNEGGETLYQDGFLLNYFAPKSFDPLPKHIVFVLDTSGSMMGLKLKQLIDAMLKILPQLNEEDIFNIVEYNTQVYVWETDDRGGDVFDGMDPNYLDYGNLANVLKNRQFPLGHAATEANIRKVQTLIENLRDDGLTNAIGALEIGLLVIQKSQIQYPNKYAPIMVFLTDGEPTVGIQSTEEILEQINNLNTASYNTPIYTLCFGDQSNWSFLNKLSLLTRGIPTNISESEDASVLLQRFYSTIQNPTLSNLTFTGFPKSAEITQTYFPLFFNGSERVVAAKGVAENDATPITVSAKSKQGLVNLQSKLGVPLTKLEKIWAYVTVKQLIDQYQVTGNTTFSTLALNLALNYSLVSDFTSLVVVKPDSLGGADTEDASIGIFPEPPGELPMCNNITTYIIDKYGTTEPDISTEFTTESNASGHYVVESDVGVQETTTTEIPTTSEIPTTTTLPTTTTMPTTTTTTTEKITCVNSKYGCCYDGVTFSPLPNGDGCDPIPNSESCSLPVDTGGCNNVTTKWFYSNDHHQCRIFRYNGCGGNGNRFATRNICENTCVSPYDKERCKLPISLGNGNMKLLSWFYNKSTDECVKYMYGGYDGNSNRFYSKQECLKICSPDKLKEMIKGLCFQPKDKGRPGCRRFEKNYYFDSSTGRCTKFWFNGCGGNDNRFTHKDVCEKMCNYSKNRATCNAPPEHGTCNTGYYRVYYFDKNTSSCKQFIYGGCGGNRNKFLSQEECEKFCK